MIGWYSARSRARDSGVETPQTKSTGTTVVAPTSLVLGRIGLFSGLIALGTIVTNQLLGFALPPPLFLITIAPAFYMAIAVLFSRKVSFWSTAIGSGVGELFNIFVLGTTPAYIALSFVPGIMIARAPETLIIRRFRTKTTRWIAIGMILATVYETLAFFFIDWPIYSFTVFYAPFYCFEESCLAAGLQGGFLLAAFDFGTLIDLVWVPVAISLIAAVRKAFNVQFFN